MSTRAAILLAAALICATLILVARRLDPGDPSPPSAGYCETRYCPDR